jgi:predicted metal-dependent HD superfamily phosphohydrolase
MISPFKKDVKLFLTQKKNQYGNDYSTNVFDELYKLCGDRYLSDRYINSLWNEIDDNLFKLNQIDKDITIILIHDVISSSQDLKEICCKYEEYEAAKNFYRFQELMIERIKDDINE